MENINSNDRQRLYELFTTLTTSLEEVKNIIHTISTKEYENVRASWLASLSKGISSAEYCTDETTMKMFLEDNDIMDEDGEFIDR